MRTDVCVAVQLNCQGLYDVGRKQFRPVVYKMSRHDSCELVNKSE
jgi:hypothetical protein